MKKILLLLMTLFLFCACGNRREDWYVFSFDDYTIAPGHDNVAFLRLVFETDLPKEFAPGEKREDVKLYFWKDEFARIDLQNPKSRTISADDAIVTRFIYYLDQNPRYVFRIDGQELSSSVKENCQLFHGEYVERNGYACAFGRIVHGQKNVVILYGDYLALDQDALNHIEIYVE